MIYPNVPQTIAKNEKGFVLVGAMVTLLILVVVGIIATTNTSLEIQIAANEKTQKETFYQADAGTRLAARLVEENLGAPGGFSAASLDADNILIDPDNPNQTILVPNPTVAENEDMTRDAEDVSDAVRDIAYYPNGFNPADPNAIPHTNIIADGLTSNVAGSGLQMLAGYEGKGKGTAGGGGQIVFNIFSQHRSFSNSESIVRIQWRHIIGLELDSRY